MDDEYWSSNGGQLDQEDPDWNDHSKLNEKKAKKLKRSKLMKGRRRALLGNDKQFNCTQCDHQPFESRTQLKEHLNEAHDGVGLDKVLYKCGEAECPFEAATQKLLNDHRKEVHGIAPSFKCRVNYARNYVQ